MKSKKVLGWSAAALGVIVLLLFVNSWTGNPLSGYLARRAAQEYIDQNYSGLELEIQRSGYNFKFSSYVIHVQSRSSRDTSFALYADSFGNIQGDDYEYEVANHFTTWRRLDDELRCQSRKLIAGELDYDLDFVSLGFAEEDGNSLEMEGLELDMTLDIHNPPLPLEVTMVFYHEDVSYSTAAQAVRDAAAVMDRQGIPVRQYSVRVIPLADKPETDGSGGSWANSLWISDFPAARLDEEDLPGAMERFEEERQAALEERYDK